MRPLFITLAVLLAIAPALAAETFNPRTISYVNLDYREFGNVTVQPTTATEIQNLELNLFTFPRQTDTISVRNLKTNPNANLETARGEQAQVYRFGNLAAGSYNFELTADVTSEIFFPKITKKIQFPYAVPDDIRQFAIPTEKTESDDPEIKQVANNLAAGEDDAFKLAAKIAKWVHESVEYDESQWVGVASAKDVLRTRKGVCDEFTNLFMALVRSLGMPARYKVGSVYTNLPAVNDFQYHAWAEVWFPEYGWVPFDPTFAEYGWIDPTHITVRTSQIVEPVAVSYTWRGGTVKADGPDTEIKILEKTQNGGRFVSTKSWLQFDETSLDSSNIIWAEVENPTKFYVHAAVWLAKAPKVEGDNERDVILAPGEKQVIGWLIQPSEPLSENFIYTYTIETNALFGENTTTNWKLQAGSLNIMTSSEAEAKLRESETAKEVKGTPKIAVEIGLPAEEYVGNNFIISLNIKNMGNAPEERFEACLDSKCKSLYIGINDNLQYNLTGMTAVGNNTHTVRLKWTELDELRAVSFTGKPKPFWIIIIEFFKSLFAVHPK